MKFLCVCSVITPATFQGRYSVTITFVYISFRRNLERVCCVVHFYCIRINTRSVEKTNFTNLSIVRRCKGNFFNNRAIEIFIKLMKNERVELTVGYFWKKNSGIFSIVFFFQTSFVR